MGKILWPDWYFDDIWHIPDNFFKKNNIRYLLCDIDNTLAPYSVSTPTASVKLFFERLKNEGVKPAFVSNNNRTRVLTFAEKTGYPAIYKAGKPFGKGAKTAMALLGATRERTAVLGDQLFTDGLAAKHIGARMILVKPIEDKPSLLFRIKRHYEKKSIDKYLECYDLNEPEPKRKLKRKMKKLRKKMRKEERKREKQ